uniref:Ig-like domain-containing protein n=1 Tax=Scleropages formosus TaxID=113540 RepID=A0A8C9RDL0_SCLFO
ASPRSHISQTPRDALQKAGSPFEITCEHDSNNDYMFWYRQDQNWSLRLIAYSYGVGFEENEKDFEAGYKVKRHSITLFTLEIERPEERDTAVYFCATSLAPLFTGTGRASETLHCEHDDEKHDLKTPTVKVLPPSPQQICNKATVTLVCVVTNFYPDHVEVNWKFNGVDVGTVGVSTDDRALQAPDGKTYSITSRFLTTKKRWFNTKNTFTCVTKFYNGTRDEFFQGSINGDKGKP